MSLRAAAWAFNDDHRVRPPYGNLGAFRGGKPCGLLTASKPVFGEVVRLSFSERLGMARPRFRRKRHAYQI